MLSIFSEIYLQMHSITFQNIPSVTFHCVIDQLESLTERGRKSGGKVEPRQFMNTSGKKKKVIASRSMITAYL